MSLAGRITSLADRIGDECKALWTAIGGKQATLVSGTNIKTVNSQSLLGSGNITISGGSGATAPVTVTPNGSNVSNIDLSLGNYFKLNLAEAPAAAIAVVDTPVKTSFGAATTGTLNLPSVLQQGDVVICAIGSDGYNAIGLPSGWTNISNQSSGTEYTRTFYKVMGAVPDTSVAITGMATSSVGISIAFRNVHSSVFDATTAVRIGSTGMPNPMEITTVTNAAMVVAIGFLDDDNVQASVTAPSGYSNLQVLQSNTTGQTVMLATKTVATAGYEDPAAFGGTGNDEWVALTIALRPNLLFPQVTVSNPPSGVVGDVKLQIISSTNSITFPASFTWKWLPDFAAFTDTLVDMITDDNGTTYDICPVIQLAKFIDRTAIAAQNIDWAVGAIFTLTTWTDMTFTFSNLQLNKTITVILYCSHTVAWPIYCKKISGDLASGLNYIQLHCTNATAGSEQVWRIISQET